MGGSRRRFRLSSLASDQSGMSIPEILVAAILLIGAVLAIFEALDTATRNAFRSEQTQVALDRAQREMELIRSVPYQQVALNKLPAAGSGQNDPSSRVSGANFALARDGSDQAPMVVDAAGMDPGPIPFESGDVSGDVYRFVTWRDDPSCLACPGVEDLKRVVVAVRLDTVPISFDRPYVEIVSDFYDPTKSVLQNPGNGNGTGTGTETATAGVARACSSSGSRIPPARPARPAHPPGHQRGPRPSQHPRGLPGRGSDGRHCGRARCPATARTANHRIAHLRLLERRLPGAQPGHNR